MKFSENWLHEWVEPALKTAELAELLTMAGLEVDSIQPAASSFSGVVVGQINSLHPHPHADKLQICEIAINTAAPLTIVTGATNVKVNDKVVVAKLGAYLPGIHQENEKLAATEIRGIASAGMLCSTQELGLAAQAEGVWILPSSAPIGQELWHYLKLNDHIIEIDLTPNRGDCLSVRGIAREVSALTGAPLVELPEQRVAFTHEKLILPVEIQAPQDCPYYVARIIENINNVETPLWLQEKLRRSEVRSIHPVVDILNFVMLELGQPMHAFDKEKVAGSLIVRHAKTGETLALLDGKEINLIDRTLVIADQHKVLALAGIMGGQESAVTASTRSIILESALFSASLMAGKARQYGLHTDSSFRFERGVDPELQIVAMERASSLIADICGGEFGPLIIKEQPRTKPEPIILRASRIQQVLGVELDDPSIVQIMHRLDCVVYESTSNAGKWMIEPPSFRNDITTEIDLIEEVARIIGYNNIPSIKPWAHLHFCPNPETGVSSERLKRTLVDFGYQEVITYTFVDNELQKKLFPEQSSLILINPISADMNAMRLSLWPGLLNTLKYNQNRQQASLKLFEQGLRFIPHAQQLIQEEVISGLAAGNLASEQWGDKSRSLDFYDVKHHIENLWALLGYKQALTFEPITHSTCHPGQTALIRWQEQEVGIVGKLHPKLEAELDLIGPIFLFELKTQSFKTKPVPTFTRPSRFPENRRDIAVIVADDLPGDCLLQFVRKTAGELLREAQIFDVYAGKGIEPGRKSIAMGLILQHPSRTLVESEIDDVIQSIINGVQKEFSAKLRD